MTPAPPRPTLFPYTTLFRSNAAIGMPVSNATMLTTIRKVIANPRPFVEEEGYIGPCRRAGIVSAGRGSGRRRTDTSARGAARSEEHTSELQSRRDLVCRLLL